MDKLQASLLVTLAINLDYLEPPRSLDLIVERNDEDDKLIPGKVFYRIGNVKPQMFRKFCENLWDKSSHAVQLTYMLFGLRAAVAYLEDIMEIISRLSHNNEEVIADWQKVDVCVAETMANIKTLQRKTVISAMLNDPQYMRKRTRSLQTSKKEYLKARDAIPREKRPLVSGVMSAKAFDFDRLFLLQQYVKQPVQDLPQPTVALPDAPELDGTSQSEASEAQQLGAKMTPYYAGVPPYPPIISDELWVYINKKLIQQQGLDQWLVNLLYLLRNTNKRHFQGAGDGQEENKDEAGFLAAAEEENLDQLEDDRVAVLYGDDVPGVPGYLRPHSSNLSRDWDAGSVDDGKGDEGAQETGE